MSTYHVVTFDHLRAAETLNTDLTELQVPAVTMIATADGGGKVYVAVPEGTDLDLHLTAVKNFSLGRGSHTVTREEIPTWTPSASAEHVDNVRGQ